jgi:flagellin-like protein
MCKKIMESWKDEEGVSPVIGVILMVAFSIVMAAVVSSWSEGIKAPAVPTTIGLDIIRDGNNVFLVITSIDPIAASPLPNVDVTYTDSFSHTNTASFPDVNVGDPIKIVTNGPVRMIITATYKDNSEKVLYSQEV